MKASRGTTSSLSGFCRTRLVQEADAEEFNFDLIARRHPQGGDRRPRHAIDAAARAERWHARSRPRGAICWHDVGSKEGVHFSTAYTVSAVFVTDLREASALTERRAHVIDFAVSALQP